MSTKKAGEYRYFLYSPIQEKELAKGADSMGKKYKAGEVFVDGKYKKYTQLSKSPTNPLYADAVIIAKGYLDKMKYMEPQKVWKVQAR